MRASPSTHFTLTLCSLSTLSLQPPPATPSRSGDLTVVDLEIASREPPLIASRDPPPISSCDPPRSQSP
uniref:Secreted protein n=1 Tax=Fagus sylvatica TaxID=28930 RepID=A0A2N9IHB2_FAGSY